jgi:hypothetical protein
MIEPFVRHEVVCLLRGQDRSTLNGCRNHALFLFVLPRESEALGRPF